MEKYTGIRAADGIAQGFARQIKNCKMPVTMFHVQDVEQELERFAMAVGSCVKQIEHVYENVADRLGEKEASFFSAIRMLLEDETLRQEVAGIIRQDGINAEAAVHEVIERYAAVIGAAQDNYMRDRTRDLKEVEERLLMALDGRETLRPDIFLEKPCIIIGKDITPEQMLSLDRNKVLAFVMAEGSAYSHAAIMAGIMGVPAVVSAGSRVLDIEDGTWIAVDGTRGEVYGQPDEETLRRFEKQLILQRQHIESLKRLKDVPAMTKSGKKVVLLANISSVDEIMFAKESGAQGIGLFRSEFLYLERSGYPSEEMQYTVYSKVLGSMQGKNVTIRTLDAGGDKKADYMDIPPEENPALGYRGIRISLAQQDIFRTQLRALYRASAHGSLSVLFPMITSVEEVRQIKEIVREVKQQLDREHIEYGQVKSGIMIETPAAALISDELASEVDFFSIGTNDLTQYTLAADRQNPKMKLYYNAAHESVLKLIEMTVHNARKHGTGVCICGELGADIAVTQRLLDMGISAISVNPSRIFVLKEKILSCE